MKIVENQLMCLAILTGLFNIDSPIFIKTLNYNSIFGTVPRYQCNQVVSQTQSFLNTLISLVNSFALMPDHFQFTNGIEFRIE